jgi:hypothetical protein
MPVNPNPGAKVTQSRAADKSKKQHLNKWREWEQWEDWEDWEDWDDWEKPLTLNPNLRGCSWALRW